jgi:hypothetical protein
VLLSFRNVQANRTQLMLTTLGKLAAVAVVISAAFLISMMALVEMVLIARPQPVAR